MSIHQSFNRTPEVVNRDEVIANGGGEGGPKVVDMSLVEMGLIIEALYGVEAENDDNFFAGENASRLLRGLSDTFAQAA